VQLAAKESQSIMREAVQKACGKPVAPPPLQPMSRTMVDKDAPKDEGEWEFRLKEGVLTIIAWNDEKNEAQFVRLVRRGTEMHVELKREESEE
jgi:hypothetical protein